MIAFEKYLIEKGFKCFHYRYENGKQLFYEGYRTPSTMTNIYNEYRLDNIKIGIGLNERDHPVTICYPRERILYNGSKCILDDQMNRVLQTIDFDIILKTIIDYYEQQMH